MNTILDASVAVIKRGYSLLSFRAKGVRDALDILLWPCLFAFVLLSIVLALKRFSSLEIDFSLWRRFDYLSLAGAGLFQLLSMLIVVLAWQYSLVLQGVRHIGFLRSATMIGINTIGKYSPGKVWGVFARGAALLRLSIDRSVVIRSSVIEQLALVHSGGAFAVITLCFREGENLLGVLCLPLAIASAFLVARGTRLLSAVCRLMRRQEAASLFANDRGFAKSYVTVFCLLSVVWILAGVALYFCIAAYPERTNVSLWNSQFVAVTAYLAGFAAIFSVAGLGVREGVMAAMLGHDMPLAAAVSIAVVHRFVTLLFDVLIGCLALANGGSMLSTKPRK